MIMLFSLIFGLCTIHVESQRGFFLTYCMKDQFRKYKRVQYFFQWKEVKNKTERNNFWVNTRLVSIAMQNYLKHVAQDNAKSYEERLLNLRKIIRPWKKVSFFGVQISAISYIFPRLGKPALGSREAVNCEGKCRFP